MEGKEVRFGIANSALFATATTDASCGAVNAMHDSFTPLGGMVPMVNILLGEVVFGGVGAGLYGMLIFVIALRLHRRPDGWPNTGISRQEDRSLRCAAVDALPVDFSADHSWLHGRLGSRAELRPVGLDKPGPARTVGDPVCIHIGDREQRLGVCWAQREYNWYNVTLGHRDVLRDVF